MPTPRVALVIATAIVIGIVLYLARGALTPFIVGLLLIYLLDPAVGWFARLQIGKRRLPRGLAVLIVYALTILLLVVGLRLLLGPLISQLLDYVRDFPRLISSVETSLAQIRIWYDSVDLPPEVRGAIDQALANAGDGASSIDFGALLPIARTVLGTAAGFFAFLIIPIWAFYILRDRVRLTDAFADALPHEWRDEIWAVLSIVERVVGRWIRAQLLLGLIVGLATFVGLLLLGVLIDPRFTQFAVLLAVIAGIFELLPIIGPILSMIPTLLVALTTQNPVIAVDRGRDPLSRRPAGRGCRARAQDPGQRRGAAPIAGHLRAHRRWRHRRPAGRHPRNPDHGRRARRLPLPVPPTLRPARRRPAPARAGLGRRFTRDFHCRRLTGQDGVPDRSPASTDETEDASRRWLRPSASDALTIPTSAWTVQLDRLRRIIDPANGRQSRRGATTQSWANLVGSGAMSSAGAARRSRGNLWISCPYHV